MPEAAAPSLSLYLQTGLFWLLFSQSATQKFQLRNPENVTRRELFAFQQNGGGVVKMTELK